MGMNGTTGRQPEVLVVDDGLFFSVRIESTLRKLGYAVKVTGKPEEARSWAEAHPLVLAIVNFGSERVQPTAVTRALKALPNPPVVLGFVSHTWIPQVRPGAKEAGCDLLVANSALSMRLPQLVAKLAPSDGSQAIVPEETEFEEE